MRDYTELQKLVEAGDLECAIEKIRKLSSNERKSFPILILEGIISIAQGKSADAISLFQKALKQRPNDVDCWYNLAWTYWNIGEKERAQEAINVCTHLACKGKAQDDAVMDLTSLQKEWSTPASGEKRKRVLFIAYYYPPLAGSGVYRSLRFAKYLPQFGWDPIILSTDKPPSGWNFRDASLLEEVRFLEAQTVRISDPFTTESGTISLSPNQVNQALYILESILKRDSKANSILQQLKKQEGGIKRLMTFPCSALLWAAEVIRYIGAHFNMGDFDAVYTTSGPYSSHLIGYYLKANYGISWVADYRDPWTLNPYGGTYDPKNFAKLLLSCLEKILLQKADRSIVTAEGLIQEYTHFFKIAPQKLSWITNGYDESVFRTLPEPQRNPKFTLTYTGLIYSGERDLSPILASVEELIQDRMLPSNDILFRFVGSSTRDIMALAEQFGLKDNITITGYVSHKEAIEAASCADLQIVMIGDAPKYRNMYTAKIFDCLRAGTPILATAPNGGCVDCMLKISGHGKVVQSTDRASIKAFLLEQYDIWKSSTQKRRLCSPQIQLFEGQFLSARLAQTLKDALQETEDSKLASPDKLETGSGVYDAYYQIGGPQQAYFKHYTESFYYSAWKQVFSYFAFLPRTTSILEIGCGPGQFANMLFDNGFTNYTGFDYSEEAIKIAKKNNPKFTDHFHVEDVFITDLLTQPYDLVLTIEVLEHISDDLAVLDRISSGKKILFSVPNFPDPTHVRYFTTVEEVKERYKNKVRILDTKVLPLTGSNVLYYIAGEKL